MLLKLARFSRLDRQIAISRLIWRMDYVDIGEVVHMHRTAVSRHMRKNIAPRLIELLAHNPLIGAA